MVLEVRNMTVAYDTAVILDGVSLGIEAGEFLTIVGPNGAGKTTLLRTICGLMSWERQMKRGMRKEVSNIIIEGDIMKRKGSEAALRGMLEGIERTFLEKSIAFVKGRTQ